MNAKVVPNSNCKLCPECMSENTYFSKKKSKWICEECDHHWNEDDYLVSSNDGKLNLNYICAGEDYWCKTLWEVAPVSLALAYHQLYEYVKANNIGCTLFLLRDVFELMIKTPVIILFNGIHDLAETHSDFSTVLHNEANLEKLYTYSLQMLSTGKWWECVRLASRLKESALMDALNTDSRELYLKTLQYLKRLYRMLNFKMPGKERSDMVTWRNQALGHSCLANRPNENYQEIPYILKMFREAGEVSIPFYRQVAFADDTMSIRRGYTSEKISKQVYVVYQPSNSHDKMYIKVRNFVAGTEANYAYFDGYEKGKAYLLDYKNGKRYRDSELSSYLFSQYSAYAGTKNIALASSENIFSENLESKDILRLEQLLSESEKIIPLTFVYKWLYDAVSTTDKGYLLLTAESGLGKTAFTDTLDQLGKKANLVLSIDSLEEWEEFVYDTAIRVWHFNSGYRSRKDIYIPGIKDAILTLSAESNNGHEYQPANKLKGNLESQWDSLLNCPDDLRKIYFAECLNKALQEYHSRTDNQRLLLVLDGIDEVVDTKELFSFLPKPEALHEGVFVLLTCRTKKEIQSKSDLAQALEQFSFNHHLEYTTDTISEAQNRGIAQKHTDNYEYRQTVLQFIEDMYSDRKQSYDRSAYEQIAERFEYRFSSITAYRRLCRMNPLFLQMETSDLFNAFWQQINQNAPEVYIKGLECILNTLAWAGEPLTLRELAYLSGERYVSFRLLGMLNDLQAFVQVIRTNRGNCYELSHAQWKDSIKNTYAYGDIVFRTRCTSLLKEIDESFNRSNIALILEDEYQGELWIITHVMHIYYQWRSELMENWWEYIRLDCVENILKKLLQHSVCIGGLYQSYQDATNNRLKMLFQWIEYDYWLLKDSQYFESSRLGERGFRENEIIGMLFVEMYQSILEHQPNDISKQAQTELLYLKAANCNRASKHNFQKGSELLTSAADSVKKAISLLEINASEELNKYFKCLYLLIRIELRRKQYKNVIEHCTKITNLFPTESNYDLFLYVAKTLKLSSEVDNDQLLYLGKALEYKGLAYRYLGDDRDLSCFCKAYSVIGSLCNAYETEWYLRNRRLLEHRIGTAYKARKEWTAAIDYINRSLHTIDCLNQISERNDFEDCKIEAFKTLGDIYAKLENGNKAFMYYENVYRKQCKLKVDKKGVYNTVKQILELPVSSMSIEDRETYEKIYDALKKEVEKMPNAYREMLEILKYMPKDYLSKIPEEYMSILRNKQNKSHIVSIDPNKTLENQCILYETKILFYIFKEKFWSNDYEKEHMANQFIVNSKKRAEQFLIKLHTKARAYSSNNDYMNQYAIAQLPAFGSICSELYLILEYFPREVAMRIPLNILVWIRNNRDLEYSYILDRKTRVDDIDYKEETLQILAWLFEVYCPNIDSLLSEPRKDIM